jgi:molecular chaperone HtpG
MTKETFTFQAEVSKLLDIVAHALYSQKEIFLRELISNASDACDKLRYESLTNPGLVDDAGMFQVTLTANKKSKTLTISDNGIGMNRDDLLETLGTIARSGTQAFMDTLTQSKDAKNKKKGKDDGAEIDLIGQFGVGFYSTFMVADMVEVTTRKAGEDTAWLWTSGGTGEFTIDASERSQHGTDVTVHLKKDEKEYLDAPRIEHIVKTYSDHIDIPIVLKAEKNDEENQTLNQASALWTREKRDISEDDYKEFYHHVGQMWDDPWMTLHNRVEGIISYTSLMFIPSSRPFDLFNPERKRQLKLYVKRVYITDNCDELLPSYFRFIRGIVDSEDLPLNISREMLQHNPSLAKIRTALTKRVFNELKKKADKSPEDYATFWDNFGSVMKEGLYEDFANREALLNLARFHSTTANGFTNLKDYVERMPKGQNDIFYIAGEDAKAIVNSPQLEGFKAKGVEVLLLTDPVDEFWIPSVGTFEEKPFKSATRGDTDLSNIGKSKSKNADDKKTDEAKSDDKNVAKTEPLIAALKVALGDKVKDVRISDRLTDSPVCLVADEGDMDMNIERMMKAHNQLKEVTPRVLELNPNHRLIKKLVKKSKLTEGIDPQLKEAALLLLDQAQIVEGEPLSDPLAFSKRMAAMMEKGLGT